MNSKQNYTLLVKNILKYQNRLATYSEESFTKKKADGIWSPAEVYAHILAANNMTSLSLKKIINKEATLTDAVIPFKAKLLLWSGRFPKGRKVPAVVEARTPKINSIADAQQSIDVCLKQLQEIWDLKSEWNQDYKIKHPVLGYLTINQWIRFMLIHTKHHYKQLDRVQ